SPARAPADSGSTASTISPVAGKGQRASSAESAWNGEVASRTRISEGSRKPVILLILLLQPPFDRGEGLLQRRIAGLLVEGRPQLVAGFEPEPQTAVDLGEQRQGAVSLGRQDRAGLLARPGGARAQGDELGLALRGRSWPIQRADRPPVPPAAVEDPR